MARFHYIVFGIISLLFFSCGQVGSITGGEQDKFAPRIIVDKVIPPIGSTNISPQIITIPFDEYIQFNKPAENIHVTPADVKLNYVIKKKSVVLSVKSGKWAPNTTYTIYLNKAVKDITEANDSIIAYVFSTGNYVDSLKTAVQVEDAYNGKPVKGTIVGLFTKQLIDDTSKVEPRYFAATDDKGIALFQYIKDTTFYVYAFEDENLNNRLDKTEKRAILRKPVKLDTIFETGPVIRLMPPETTELRILNNEVIPTTTWGMSFNRSLSEDENLTFLSPEPTQVIWNNSKDSVSAFYESTTLSGTLKGILYSKEKADTLTKKYFFKNKKDLQLKVSNNLTNKKLWANDTLKLKLNEPFIVFDKSLIKLEAIREKDTLRTELEYDYISTSPIEKQIVFDKRNLEKVFLSIPPAAIRGQNYTLTDSLNLDFPLQKEKETGVMIVEFDTIPAYGVLVITNIATKSKRNIVFDGIEKFSHRIEFMQAGEYSFHYIYDLNKDGVWTSGSIFEEKEAEVIHWFDAKSTIRANWEVKTILPIKIVEEELEIDKGDIQDKE